MTDPDDRIDLSSLDPSRDPERWEAMVQSITQHALERRARSGIVIQINQWMRPALAAAAAIALAVMGSALARPSAGLSAPVERDPAMTLLAWGSSDRMPTAEEILETLGGPHGAP